MLNLIGSNLIYSMQKKIVTGIGELLWDHFPDHKRPGGAPANVVYHATLLGAEGRLVSRIGRDNEGKELAGYLESKQMDTSFIQMDNRYPTGKVIVHLNEENEPSYEIVRPVAWDVIEWNRELGELVSQTDAVVFGTLAQRSESSASTVQRVLQEAGSDTLKVLDLNFRQDQYSRQTVEESLMQADVVKMNQEESEELKTMFQTCDSIRSVLDRFDVKGICLTKGSKGSEWISRSGNISQGAFETDLSKGDAVGLGDGFTAVLTIGLLQKIHPAQILRNASLYTSMLAEKKGGMPALTRQEIEKVFN